MTYFDGLAANTYRTDSQGPGVRSSPARAALSMGPSLPRWE